MIDCPFIARLFGRCGADGANDGHAGYHAARVGARWLEWFANRAEVRQP